MNVVCRSNSSTDAYAYSFGVPERLCPQSAMVLRKTFHPRFCSQSIETSCGRDLSLARS